jgi:hypothetical protein
MPFVKGYKWTDKQREECGFKKGISPWNKGEKLPYKSKPSLQGRTSYFKGKHHSLEAILKMKKSAQNRPNRRGPKGKPWSLARRISQEQRNGLPYKRPDFIGIRRKSLMKNGKEYPFNWSEIRKNIYRRDGWRCQECGVHCQVGGKTKIQCHHIDYDTTNNHFSNLITLCSSCHAKTNYKREDWKNHYKKIIGGRGLVISEN